MTNQKVVACKHGIAAAGVAMGLFAMAALPAQADGIDDYVHSEMVKRKIPGMALAVLRDMGCDLAQGFALSRPVPAQEVLAACAQASQVASPHPASQPRG